jgi:hypothetical protein
MWVANSRAAIRPVRLPGSWPPEGNRVVTYGRPFPYFTELPGYPMKNGSDNGQVPDILCHVGPSDLTGPPYMSVCLSVFLTQFVVCLSVCLSIHLPSIRTSLPPPPPHPCPKEWKKERGMEQRNKIRRKQEGWKEGWKEGRKE